MRTDLVTTIDDRPRGLMAACWWAYEHAPAGLETGLALARRYLAPWLSPRLPVRLHRLEGPQAGEIVSIGDAMTLSYLLQRLGPATVASTDHTGLLGLAPSLRRAIGTRDLALASVPRILAGPLGRDCLRVPGLVSFRLPVGPTLEATLERATTTVRRDARRVLEGGVGWRISRDPADFDRFYDGYYAPSVRLRFGDLGVLRERTMLRRQFRHGGALIWLEQQGRPIAGTVVQVRRGTLHGLVAAADPAQRHDGRAGPQFALKIAAMALAPRLGASSVDLGGTVPSLRDGNMRAKRAFGASVRRFEESHRELLLAWRPGSFAARRLLHEAPLLIEAEGRLGAVAAPPPGAEASPATAVQLWRQYAPEGLERLFLLGARTPVRLRTDGSEGDGPILLWPDTGAGALAEAMARLECQARPPLADGAP
ncbi:MAG: GNAT family N-acetyltransferase [Geminicoccaceae bacterium]